jgi:Tol biopolymer transport system component
MMRASKPMIAPMRCAAVLAVLAVAGLARAAPPTAAGSASLAAGDSILFVAKTVDAFEIREIGADGGGEHVVRGLPPSLECCEEWSPTGSAIAFDDAQGNVVVVRINDGRTTAIAQNVASFAWSPDGRQVAYIARVKGLQIFIVNADGTGRRKIAGAHSRTMLGIRRDSAFGSSPDRRAVVYVNYGHLAWSPDKRNLAYLRSVSYSSHEPPVSARVFLSRVNGKRRRQLARLRPFVPQVLAWSPNSANIAVGGYRDSGVMTVSTRRNTKKYVTDCCVGVYDLAWSPDGKRIVFFSDSSAGPDGAIVNADGSHLRILHVTGGDAAWSQDSKRIAFEHGPGSLEIVNANGTGLRTLTKASRVAAPIWK